MEVPLVAESQSAPLVPSLLMLLVLGVGALIWFSPLRLRRSELTANSLTPWRISWMDFGLWLCAIYFSVFAAQVLAFQAIPRFLEEPPPWHPDAGNATALLIMAGITLQAPLLLAFFALRAWQPQIYHLPLSGGAARRPPTLFNTLLFFLLVMPLVIVISLAWTGVLAGLEQLGVAVDRDPQQLVQLLSAVSDPLVFLVFLALAVGLAPIAEELIFRAGLYRFFKSRFPRLVSMLFSALLFALLHANLASFLPLLFLGVALAVVYEITGSIRGPILLHALFNAFQLSMILLIGDSL